MKNKLFATLALAATLAVPSLAMAGDVTNLDDLLAKGGKKLSHAEIAAVKMNNTLNGLFVKKNIKWKVEYRPNGTKISTFGGKEHNRKWSFKNGRWCESSGERMKCDVPHHRLANTCYLFDGDGSLLHRFKCG